ncbi:hypothetical protein PENSUB_7189 [Penicillium subrubescens]|uniref:Uncharacterized protein n=1 Tax=Penicillium subrubescens TaxID=1316194 RepID=A0A1Q5TPE5_9EURO|nr:hypothetical protein PENSUB_7189 [Penicillium subrubescens]
MVVWPQGEPLHPAGYISRPPVDPDCRATATAPGAPGCPRMPRPLRPCWGAPPSTGQFGCVENRPRELASLGVSKTVPTSPRPPAGQLWAGCESPPPPTPCHPLSPTRAAHLPTGNWPAPPGASRASPPPRRAGWPASHRPSGRRGLRVVRRAPRPPAQGERTPARFHRRASRLAHGVTSGLPTSRAPAASGPPPQSTLQPGAVGPVASRLTIYSPTPFGWGNESRKRRPAPPMPLLPAGLRPKAPASTGQLGVCRKRPAGTKARPANWRVPPTARLGPREARPSTAPSKRPALPGPLMGRY